MADPNWTYSHGNRQQEESFPPNMVNRPHANFEVLSGHCLSTSNYNACDDEVTSHSVARVTDYINEAYDCYLRTVPISTYGDESGGSIGWLDDLYEIDDFNVFRHRESIPPVRAPASQFRGVDGQPEILLPHNASSTLFVEGLPANCTRREVSHIFRPFLGYTEVRLARRGSRYFGGDPVVLCYVDFQTPAHAATAMDALQGYIFDENDRDSGCIRLQFARSLGAWSGGGHHARR